MTLAGLNAQIRASRKRLRELLRQKEAIDHARGLDRKARNREMLRLFDDEGYGAAAMARELKMPDSSRVRQFLHSRGRTKRGREMARSQLAAMAETQR